MDVPPVLRQIRSGPLRPLHEHDLGSLTQLFPTKFPQLFRLPEAKQVAVYYLNLVVS
jgi:hypothetical protein